MTPDEIAFLTTLLSALIMLLTPLAHEELGWFKRSFPFIMVPAFAICACTSLLTAGLTSKTPAVETSHKAVPMTADQGAGETRDRS